MNLGLTFKTKLWYRFTGSFQFSNVHAHRLYMRAVDGRLCGNHCLQNADKYVVLLRRVFQYILASPLGESNTTNN